METTEQKRSYKDTINKPQTAFPMKGNLVQNEPASLKRWEAMKLYESIRAARAGSPKYLFHDGPPYANGPIHIGHLLNKVLKDLVVRSKTMAGFDTPYIPGWDCHGLPIEHKVMLDLGEKARTMEPYQIRRKCQENAAKFIKVQAAGMQRLLTLADYEHPYITMAPEYEAGVLEVFADLVERGLVYRALKPVHWSIANRTALAEAELEYMDREDTSVYVLFELNDPAALATACGFASSGPVYLMIWTTTPWTLPANLAVAVHERFEYSLAKLGGRTVVVATELLEKIAKLGGEKPQVLARCPGAKLAGLTYRHPFIDDARKRPVVTAQYVTLEDGTGLVHTAPGHGVEDYQTGMREGLEIYSPVKADGTFDQTAPAWLQQPGVDVWKANDLVVQKLRESGHLFFEHRFTHSYPHDWRGKSPVIFRATEQWFIGVDKELGSTGGPAGHGTLRSLALRAADREVQFIPGWGRNRMRGMLESRPDWCISRQRAWGLPIPAFYDEQGRVLLTPASARAVSQVIRQQGSDLWFKATAAELLAQYDPTSDPAAPDWLKAAGREALSRLQKGNDIFDVWFESGSSWNAVLRQRGLGYPADLYTEGSDQHRGWFQASLLPALGATGVAPYKTLLTHGFIVDEQGDKMSKSLGNTVEVEDLLKEFGADVARWWVARASIENDIKAGMNLFKHYGEEYRKVRNTARYLLSNLSDYTSLRLAGAAQLPFGPADAASVDAWAMGELAALVTAVRAAYEALDFRKASELLFNFCNATLSSVYIVATRDRLYCDKADSPRRRRSQAVFHATADAIIRLVAPILPHSADEAWLSLHGKDVQPASVHLALFPEPPTVPVDPHWAELMNVREGWLKRIEEARQSRGIENPLDCGLRVPDLGPEVDLSRFDPVDLADLCGISRLEVVPAASVAGPEVLDLRNEPRCERSWKRDGTVKPRSDGGMLSDRDAAALGV